MKHPIMFRMLTACGLSLAVIKADAGEFDFWGFNAVLKNEFSEGLALRTEKPDIRLIGKLNVNPSLCPDHCTSFTNDPAPNQRLVDAPGAFFGSNKDNGDLNYHQWGLTAANNKLTTELSLSRGETSFKFGTIMFYDPANYIKYDVHPDTNYQPAKTDRSSGIKSELGKSILLKDAFVNTHFEIYDHPFSATIGYQHIRWGESNYFVLNSLSQISPPDSRLYHFPNSPISEIFKPTPAILLNTSLRDNLSLDVMMELGWSRVIPDPNGAFNSNYDFIENNNALISLGNYSEDPNGLQRLAFPGSIFSNTSLTAKVRDENYAHPNPWGQGGFKLSWYLPDFNNGTELDFYALNYHSQLPYVSAFAANESCARNSTNIGEAFEDCHGFEMSRYGKEPLPLDTVQLFIDYPRNIQMFGASFNTNVGSWSLAGEYSLRPQLPVQVAVSDIVFTALQPAFPRQSIPVNVFTLARYLPPVLIQDPTLLIGLNPKDVAEFTAYLLKNPLVTTYIPGAAEAVPDYYEGYTGMTVQPNQKIHGYVKLPVDQLDLTAIRILGRSENPLFADQVQLLTELGFTHVWNFPNRSQLQLEGGDNNGTHASAGADGTGSGGVPDANRQNPTQQTHGFASSFAWGLSHAAASGIQQSAVWH